MTVKKQLLIVLILIAGISVCINSLVLNGLTNRYFGNYLNTTYNIHYNKIINYSTSVLKSKAVSQNQIAIDLETHLVDSIVGIKLYDSDGNMLADVSSDNLRPGNGMQGMMGRMMDIQPEEVEHANIYDGNTIIGQVNITRYSSIEDTLAAGMFRASLVKNSIISLGIVLLAAIIIGILVSRRLSRDLINTAEMAQNIDIGNDAANSRSKVKEIRVIQQSLESLSSRLKLRQKSRKTLIDELIHQTRTPLTIIKTHLEGIEDGVIEMGPEEINICENQIENITSIIKNMSSMIDVERQEDILNIEEFEFSHLIRQIVDGLKVQFEKKQIDLKLNGHDKILIRTDKYKLSQAIYNILTNAYKYTEPGGTVLVDYKSIEDKLAISIEDTGHGIGEEDQIKIFDAYYKGRNSSSAQGEGLGLYVAKENLLKINGTITLKSQLNRGSCFTITLPRLSK